LRSPVFLRIREDKAPEEVRGEEARAGNSNDPPEKANVEEGRAVDPEDPPETAAGKGELQALLQQLDGEKTGFTLPVEGHNIPLNNLNKVMWPAAGNRRALTKHDLLVYLTKTSGFLLPHLHDRPITLSRYPNGLNGEHFWQKHVEDLPILSRPSVL